MHTVAWLSSFEYIDGVISAEISGLIRCCTVNMGACRPFLIILSNNDTPRLKSVSKRYEAVLGLNCWWSPIEIYGINTQKDDIIGFKLRFIWLKQIYEHSHYFSIILKHRIHQTPNFNNRMHSH